MAPALALEITGLANGAPVEVVGSGEIDAGCLCRRRSDSAVFWL